MNLTSTQLWLGIGIALIILELVTTTFFVLFFGVAALAVALISFFGVESLTIQLVVFAVLGIAGMVLFRGKVLAAFAGRNDPEGFNSLHNKQVLLDNDVPAGGRASIMHQGTTWTAVNESAQVMKAGETVLIARVDGVKLVLARLPVANNS